MTRKRSGSGRRCARGRLKKALRERRKIVFIDESGLSERPHRVRTWAPRGETPVLQYHFHWKTLSAIAGVTVWRFYFRLYEGTVRKEEVVAFLRHLRRHVRGKLPIIWDNLKQHRSRGLRRESARSDRSRVPAGLCPRVGETGQVAPQVTPQVTPQVVAVLEAARDAASRRSELQSAAHTRDRKYFRRVYLEPLIAAGWLEMTIPDKPQSRLQRLKSPQTFISPDLEDPSVRT